MAKDVELSSIADNIELRKQNLSEAVAAQVMSLFAISVAFTFALTLILAGIDSLFIWYRVVSPEQRLINEHVLMAIIGATIIQMGAGFAAIVYALFRKPKPENEAAS